MDNEITFESGTNELRLLLFQVENEYFGINIAKVSEIMRLPELTPVPSAPEEIEGMFMHRDKLVTVIDLHKVLHHELNDEHGNGLLIMCDFEKLSVAYHVSTVNSIQVLGWSAIEKPPAVQGGNDSITIGIAKIENRIIMMLDFEKIICDLNYGKEFEVIPAEEIQPIKDIDYSRHIVIAEDSPFLNKILFDSLKKAGFKNINTFLNGAEAWEYIKSQKGSGKIKQTVAAVISDIEMPQMDGHSLTKNIKQDKELRNIPVFMFSSLIHENMRMRGDSAGADGQFARSELSELLKALMEELVSR